MEMKKQLQPQKKVRIGWRHSFQVGEEEGRGFGTVQPSSLVEI